MTVHTSTGVTQWWDETDGVWRKVVGVIGPPGADAPVRVRTTETYATTALAAGATSTGSLSLGAAYRLYKVTFNFMGRLRIYTDAAHLAADAARAIGSDPADNSGLMFEYVADAAGTFILSPLVDGFTDDGEDVHLALTNTDTVAHDTTVDLLYVRTE